MKKVLLATVILAGSMAFMSCKKDYTCACTTTDSSGFFDDMTTEITIKDTKKKATDACEALNSTVLTMATTCKIK